MVSMVDTDMNWFNKQGNSSILELGYYHKDHSFDLPGGFVKEVLNGFHIDRLDSLLYMCIRRRC
jgi:hypothetical protein